MSDELKISERIWAKIHDHNGILDDDFECIAHDAEVIEKEIEELKKYAQHLPDCELFIGLGKSKGERVCTCGLRTF